MVAYYALLSAHQSSVHMQDHRHPWPWRSGLATTSYDEWRLYWDSREYQDNAAGCPACGRDLHYSSDFERSVCEVCGWVSGSHGFPLYRQPMPLSEFHTVLGMVAEMRRWRQINSHEVQEMVEAYAPYGSFYRPYWEMD